VSFDVEVFEVDDGRLALAATGPISIDVEYVVTPVAEGAEVRASVTVEGRGLMGRVLAHATDALLAAGALNAAVGRIARELEPQQVAA
jgi:dihydroxyacetone kinase